MSNNDPEHTSMVARWRKIMAERLRPAGRAAESHTAELAEFHERLEQLRALAETTPDPVRVGSLEQLWRTMGEELGFIAADLDRAQITPSDLPEAYRAWLEIGASYADSYLDNDLDQDAARRILGTDADGATMINSEGDVWSDGTSNAPSQGSAGSAVTVEATTPSPTAFEHTAAVDTSACTAAVSRATVSADTARRNVSDAVAAAAGNDRDAELAAWSQADRTGGDHAIEKNDATVSDDSPSW